MHLSWTVVQGPFDSFLVQYKDKDRQLQMVPMAADQREVTIEGLQPGRKYKFLLYGLTGRKRLGPISALGVTASEVDISAPDHTEPPEASCLGMLAVTEATPDSLRLSWAVARGPFDSFVVQYQDTENQTQALLVDGDQDKVLISGLEPKTSYKFFLYGLREETRHGPVSVEGTTVLESPRDLQFSDIGETSAKVKWVPPTSRVDSFKISYQLADGAPPLQASAPGSAVDYPLTDLALDTNYRHRACLQSPNFTSPASITFTTGLKPPQDLEAKEVTPRTALLTWTEPEVPPTGYLLSFDTPGGQIQEILLPAGTTSHRLLRLFPSTFYSAQLRAIWGESLTPPVLTSFTTGGLRIPFPRDCGEELKNGPSASKTTTIFLNGNRERPLDVFCDMETDGGGWLVFQRRMDGQTDFWRDWEEYAHGFGNISGEFWLGNEALHSLTQAGDYSLRVDLRAGKEAVFAQYDFFRVDSAKENYRLHLEGYHGTAGDSMSYHSGSVFSARDRDPNNLLISCAVSYRGAWWYRNCHYANLNGLYGSTVDHQGVSWYHWKGFEFSVPFTEMKLRPRNFQVPTRGT